MTSTSTIGIIAGAGQFPFYVAREAKHQGRRVVGFGIRGWAEGTLQHEVDVYHDVAIGQLGRLIQQLKADHVTEVLMAGKVTKAVLVNARESFDAEALGILMRAGGNPTVPALLGAVAKRLGRDGITLIDSSTFLKESLCPAGVLTTRRPTPVEEDDIQLGCRAARAMASLDIGQTIVMHRGVIVAVEALEGTDAAIRRAGTLVAEGGCVVVKTGAPEQDRRFDLPIIGASTISILQETRATCLAVEAGVTLLLDRERVIASANDAKISIVGVKVSK